MASCPKVRSRVLVAFLLLGSFGCIHSSYRPSSSHRLVERYDKGALVYTRDGRSFDAGLFGGGLIEAVDGNATAVASARSARNRSVVAFLVTVAALTCSLDALVLRRDNRGFTKFGYIEGSVCLSAISIGQMFRFSADSRRLDAINLYNDGIAPQGDGR